MGRIGYVRTALGLLVAAALICCAWTGVAAAVQAAPHALRPASPLNGGKSPFKLTGSAAHGILARSGTRGGRLASPLSSPLSSPLAAPCSASCSGSLLYHKGGSVMHKEKLYLIQWEPSEPSNNGQAGTTFEPLPSEYAKEIGTFLTDIAAESGKLGNVYSVDALYGEPEAARPGEYSFTFGGDLLDTKPYPARSTTYCPTEQAPATQPCIADTTGALQLGTEVAKFVEAEHLPTGLEAIYFVLFPHEVNSCSGSEGGVAACNTNFYCAYHTAVAFKGNDTVYANMPYDDVEGCQTPDQPHESAADDEINTLSHENNEAVTDPFGNAWFDYRGDEVADKCTYPYFNPSSDYSPEEDDYGALLGGTRTATYETVVVEGVEYKIVKQQGNSYNQAINGGHFLLQREWSNAAGGCVQQAPHVAASFAVTRQSETEFTFDAGTSTTEAGAITEYQWEFNHEAGGPSGREVKHSFAGPGKYLVKLTVTNNSGATGTSEQEIEVTSGGGVITSTTTTTSTTTEPAVTTTTTATRTSSVTSTTTSSVTSTATTSLTFTAGPVTTTVTSNAPIPPVTEYTSAQIAKLLGLPANGAKLSGAGAILLGHATCGPACGLNGRMLVVQHTGKRITRITIGSLKVKVPSKGTESISLQLNAKGKSMLRKAHSLSVLLALTVQDSAGASWLIERRLTLTSSAAAARRRGR